MLTILSDEGSIEDGIEDILLTVEEDEEMDSLTSVQVDNDIIKEETMAKASLVVKSREQDLQERKLNKLLTEFTNIPGVSTICLVGRDGFLLNSVARGGVDPEMIGAIASSGFGTSESMGNQLEKGKLSMTMIEYENGPVMLSPVGKEAFLVVVADKDSNLGMIRLKLKKHTPEIQAAAAI